MDAALPITIVIVEDDAGHARLIELGLQRAHIANNVVFLRDGQDALDYFFAETPSSVPFLLLLDLSLPVVDGYEVLKRLKHDERTQHIPAMILTAVGEPVEMERCDALGCHIYITKPVEYMEFANALKQLGFFLSIIQLPHGVTAETRGTADMRLAL
jgi:CheY-like chemotaxis protein